MTSPVCKVFDKPIDSNQKIVACSNKLSHLKKLTQMNTQEKQKGLIYETKTKTTKTTSSTITDTDDVEDPGKVRAES
uniref:Uncharacterized protein n=1 Tax=Caenorhabditis japonica TaxID=281687 RepID=A0A8R1ES29_CAEJA